MQGLDAGGLKVLVVDDSRVARSQIEGVLRQLGIESLMAGDGREALTLLQTLATQGPIDDQLLMRSEEHTSELQSLMRISYADFCLQKQKKIRSVTTRTKHVP